MPKFDDYIKDIDKAGNPIPNQGAFTKLIRWFGDALRDFIEDTDFKPDNNKKAKEKDVKAEGKKIQKLLDKYPNFTATTTDYIDRVAMLERNKAAAEKASADNTKAISGEEASEYYVDAAVSNFRAALCYYIQGNRSSADYSKQDVIQAAFDYAQMLIALLNGWRTPWITKTIMTPQKSLLSQW